MAQVMPSVCRFRLSDTCSLAVTRREPEDRQGSRLLCRSMARGTICGKVSRYPEFVHGPDRLLLTPVARWPKGDGKFTFAWDEALT